MNKLFEIAIAAIALILLGCACFFFLGGRPPNPPSVIFVGLTNNPTPQMVPVRVAVAGVPTGLCALFWVTNAAGNENVWFKTASLEQKSITGWQTYVPSGASWTGIEGGLWTPGYGCLIAVGWPPGLPTNATWRLKLDYGAEPSGLGLWVNQKMGRDIIKSGSRTAVFPRTEVSR